MAPVRHVGFKKIEIATVDKYIKSTVKMRHRADLVKIGRTVAYISADNGHGSNGSTSTDGSRGS